MPGTTRYSATFDRTYEEDDRADPPPPANTRRSRSLSWQAPPGFGGRPYTPLGGRPPSQRSSSTDNGPSKATDYLATRAAAKAAAKAHNNPFQFVKVGTCPLYKNAEELLKKSKEVKKQDVLKEEEEDWQSNLDSWKSRRRKMSEDVFRRQEEIKQFELEEQEAQLAQKKTKTFSEMVESRANRGRTLSLCLLSSPLEFQDWEFENKTFKNGSCSTFTDESEENSTVNSEDEGVSVRGRPGRPPHYNNLNNHRTNSDAHIEQNGSKLDLNNESFNKLADISADNGQIKPKEGSYIDSGLESISSSHRAGDTPDSGSDFSQDSNSSIDCDSPRTGVNILEEFRTKSLQTQGQKLKVKLSLVDQSEEFGFTFQCGKDSGQVHITSVIQGSIAESSGVHLGDQIISINGIDVNSRTHKEIASIIQKGREKEEVNLLLWRHIKANGFSNGEKHVENPVKSNKSVNANAKSESQMYERSIESENEMFVDDYEELERQSELLNSSNKSETTCTSSQGDSKGNIPLSNSKDSVKPPLAPKTKESVLNGAVNEQTKNGNDDSELNSENQKKNIIKVKRVRKKGVYALDVSATPNPIPQEGIPVSTLYPLSPVTELPSPAEESKSIASTISSNSTTLTSNSLNSSITKEKPKEAEVKSSSFSAKEKSKATTSDLKCTSLKTSVPSSKIENKTESSNDTSLAASTKSKDQNSVESSPDEKSKIISSPKKTKVKVKKTNTICEQNPSEASPKNEELMNKSVAQASDLSVKKMTSDSQSQKESSTNNLSDTKKVSVKKEENIVDSQEKDKISKEASLDSHKTIAETSNSSVSITAPSKDVAKEKSKKEDNTSPVTKGKELKEINKNENKESSKREKDTPPVEPDLCVKEAKLVESKNKTSPSDEKKKLSLNLEVQKQVENSVPVSPVTPAKSPKTPQDEKLKSPFAQKKGKAKSKENDAPPTNLCVQEAKLVESKDKASLLDEKEKLSLNLDVQKHIENSTPVSPLTNVKSPKTPQDEKSKTPFAPKKGNSKSKENDAPPTNLCDQEAKLVESKNKTSPSDEKKKLSLNLKVQQHVENCTSVLPVTPVKSPKTPQDEKLKPPFAQKKGKAKSKENDAPPADLCVQEAKLVESKNKTSPSEEKEKLSLNLKEQKQVDTPMSPVTPVKSPKTPQEEKSKPPFAQKKGKAKSKENDAPPANLCVQEAKLVESKNKTSPSEEKEKLSLNLKEQNQVENCRPVSPVTPVKSPKTPQAEKSTPPFAQKKGKAKSKENNIASVETAVSLPEVKSAVMSKKTCITNNASSSNENKNISLPTDALNQPQYSAEIPLIPNLKSPQTPKDDKTNQPFAQKTAKTISKNTNSQKVNSPAKQNEDLMNFNSDSLNIVFQSEPKSKFSETQSVNVKNSENNSDKKTVDLVPDVPPVEKVAEEMEKLILEQLEEEERAKELASVLQSTNSVESPEHLLIAPSKSAEPPKEKPPPPPPSANEGSQKDPSLKRVNSTKRIKKEIHKRRSNFLGIDNVDESIVCSEPSIPPPPALEEILKAEMELDRQSRLKIESASTERLTLEEKEIMQKEREIIESLESEEREKQLLNGSEDFENNASAATSDAIFEDDRIISLKNERKRMENERFLTEEQQQLNQVEEKQLREREEFVRKQEAGKSAESLSDSSLSVTANVPNTSKPVLSSLTETESKVLLSDSVGEGKSISNNSSIKISENKSSECDAKVKATEKPALPPKPLKKKEAIRKERERLRQEQEALQREREEHRRKLMLEQEELLKHQKSHAPDAPASRLGPLPPLVPPNFPTQLTTTTNAIPNARESTSFPSRSHHGTPNNAAGSMNAVELMGPPVVRQNKMPASRKAVVQIEAWGQQKMPSVRKQNHDSLTESRYNQNHWLIQEAEMRRIAELKERQQRATQLPCSQTHLAEDDVCSNPPRVPVISPTHNPHLNYAVQDKMWNYGQSNMPPKKYPAPVVKEPLHAVYPRETVSQQPPTKPSRVVPMERQEQMLSVSGRKRCSHCNEELGRGAAMIIESLQLYYHIHCFQCCVCQAQLGNGSCGTDVRVRNNKLHCHNCYSNDEAGLKFSQV